MGKWGASGASGAQVGQVGYKWASGESRAQVGQVGEIGLFNHHQLRQVGRCRLIQPERKWGKCSEVD